MILCITFIYFWIYMVVHINAWREIKNINLALQDYLRKRGGDQQ